LLPDIIAGLEVGDDGPTPGAAAEALPFPKMSNPGSPPGKPGAYSRAITNDPW